MEAYLVLEDGHMFKGRALGCIAQPIVGKVVFNTTMIGYQEVLTDPSNKGLLVVMTYPELGNYGTKKQDDRQPVATVAGLIVRSICDHPSNFGNEMSLPEYLEKKKVAGIVGVDTRAIVKHIRKYGAMKGAVVHGNAFSKDGLLEEMANHKDEFSVREYPLEIPVLREGEQSRNDVKVGIVDFGVGTDLINAFLLRGVPVVVLGQGATPEEVRDAGINRLVVAGGPGSPQDYAGYLPNLKEILGMGIPTLGIGLGHLMIAIANGGVCRPLKYGQRGKNIPVTHLPTLRTYITAQNNGYVLEHAPSDMKVTYQNLNDKTICGGEYLGRNIRTVQFEPDVNPGTSETAFVYDEFVKGEVVAYANR